jgi:general secretion pathway protein D
MAADLTRARAESQTTSLTAVGLAATSTPGPDNYAQAALAVQGAPDELPLQVAQLPEATPLPAPGAAAADPNDPLALLEAGEQALRAGDRATARQMFEAAFANRTQLDVLSQQKLQGHLQLLAVNDGGNAGAEPIAAPLGEPFGDPAAGQSVAARQLSAEIGKRQSEAEKLRETDPTAAISVLRDAKAMVDQSDLEDALKRQLQSRIDMSLAATEKYILDHKAELELNAANREILDELDRERQVKQDIQYRIQEMVNQYNQLNDEHRFAEAEVVANRLYAMAPDDLVSQQVHHQAKTMRREMSSQAIRNETEEAVYAIFEGNREDAAAALRGAKTDYSLGDNWPQIVAGRGPISGRPDRSLKEIEIEQKLKTPVLPQYENTPLSDVVKQLSELAGVNIHLDPRGLEQEGVAISAPITFKPMQEVSLKSALNLILDPLHLTYTIRDETLKITSTQIADGEVYPVAYPVGDLVIPIPNFVPTNNMGLQGLINDAYSAMGGVGYGTPGPMTMVSGRGPQDSLEGGPVPAGTMAQFPGNAMAAGGGPGGNVPVPVANGGPGGLGGAANADFDSLIDLIVSTIDSESWAENGTGTGEIQPFPTNLSLVISQTQRVHEQIADLLEQLRRLQDLQVTVEVRFIRLTDSFFERIGVDFDFNIEDGSGISTNPAVPNALIPGAAFEPPRASASVGISSPTGLADFPNYTVDLDMPFRQGGFGFATPQFGGFDANAAGSFGFAILSDIEAFFLIEAAQGDRRANVLQAPKVTLFNGQQANVIDASFTPFVISVVPVVGDFAAAQQPVIVVLSEGTIMSVQAVVSDDRRYVRLTLVPYFSQIGEVRTFTFEGTETSRNFSSSTDDDEDGKDEQNEDDVEITRSGTTVQLPTLAQITVTTTVSVPDGGTVLLGGIKRLREGRNEFGIPLLSKLPYADRLFRNVAIGRETESLMMMVTPHIIIQEEEEQRLGIPAE